MNRKIGSYVLIALLIASTIALAGTVFLAEVAAQRVGYNYAWLKIVTSAWKGTADTSLGAETWTPVMPAGTTFPERYNVTNVCVETWRIKAIGEDYGGVFYPNATGFVRVRWPRDWQNVTIVVKAKSYQGECIGVGDLYGGIIVYWLTINASKTWRDAHPELGTDGTNATLNDDGILDTWAGREWDDMQLNPGRAGLKSGPLDVVDRPGGLDPVSFAGNFSDPRNAWVARAAYIFKVFHEHTWYDIKDTLTYAIIHIYDVDHTSANSEHSLLQAAITGQDGQSRYTREIYPTSAGVGDGKFAQNKYVPIPLQIMNLANETAFHGGIGDPEDDIPVGAPHLNATKRVWWETVLVNQTFYVGREYNETATGTSEYEDLYPDLDKVRPLFGAYAAEWDPAINPTRTQGDITGVPAGPLSMALNDTVTISNTATDGFEDWDFTANITRVTNFNNNTVFYARFCVQDADLNIQHPEVGDKMVNAEVTVNLKSKPDKPYYLTHNILNTDNGGCTDDPHKWPGYLRQFSRFARFPNATNWGLRGSLNASKHFFPTDDEGPAWRAGGYFEKAWGGAWDGPWKNSGKNWSALIPKITYMKTRTLKDDPNYDGFDVQVKWKGGSRNGYGGTAVLVDSVRVRNPYAIALMYNFPEDELFGEWIRPSSSIAANTKILVKIHKAQAVTITYDQIFDMDGNGDPETTVSLTDTLTDVEGITLELLGVEEFDIYDDDTLGDTDDELGMVDFEVTYITDTYFAINIVENETGRWIDYANVTALVIDDAFITVKKDTVVDYLEISFQDYIGKVDFGPDGVIDYTAIKDVSTDGGACEVEIWTVPPESELVASDQISILISCNSYDFLDIEGISLPSRAGPASLLVTGPISDLNYLYLDGADDYVIFADPVDNPPTGNDELTLNGRLGPKDTGTPLAAATFDAGYEVDIYTGLVSAKLPLAALVDLDFDDDHEVGFRCLDLDGDGLGDEGGLTATLHRGLVEWDPDSTGTPPFTIGSVAPDFTGTVETTPLDPTVTECIKMYEPVVPLEDFISDDRHDANIFGGYDDFALLGAGHVYITAWVHDIAFKVVDNMGNPLPAPNTEVRLIRLNGPDVVKSGGGFDPDRIVGGLQWSYKMHGEGWAVFYQLPGAYAYDVQVFFDGNLVYDEAGWEIPKLEKTEFITLVTNVFKVKLVFEDCNGQPLLNAYARYINQAGRRVLTLTDPYGAVDLGYTAMGTITIEGVWWKGVWVKFLEAYVGEDELKLNPEGTLTVTIDKNIDAPIELKANIFDIVFTPWDFNRDHRIPRLNITLMWVGEHPLTGDKLWFLETLDPTGDTHGGAFNTSVRVDQFLNYTVRYFQSKPTEEDELKSYEKVEYVFYKMPPTYYNITVTTVTDARYDRETEQTPGNSKWPGRDIEVPYEIKIDYTGTSAPPSERTTPPDTVDDRVVLRVISTLNPNAEMFGEPVVSEALNPAGVGDFTRVTECTVKRDLLTWAHTFWKRVIDGELRVGDAIYHVVNDNEVTMEFYNPESERFEIDHVSFWTEDVLDTTWLKRRSQWSSTIWWNGSYRLQDLIFETNKTYSYSKAENASFIVDKFYNETAPNDVSPTLNFTVVGTELLWKTDRRFAAWVDRIEGNTWKNWYPAWFVVYELPTPADEYRVEAGANGKGVLPIPIPVAFIKLGAFAKDGRTPLNKALIELWTLHIDDAEKVDISEQEGEGAFLAKALRAIDGVCEDIWTKVAVEWEWEKKVKETDEPQVFERVKWDRIWVTFKTYGMREVACPVELSAEYVMLLSEERDVRLSTPCEEGQIEIWIHFVSGSGTTATFTVEVRYNGDLLASKTGTIVDEGTIEIDGDGLEVYFLIHSASPHEVIFDVDVSGSYWLARPTEEVLEEKTIFVQVPPEPAKLILRDVIDDVDVAISQSYIYPLIDSECPVDQNVGIDDPWATPDGLLSYGRWYTDEDGYVDSFKDLGKTDPRYGAVVLPTSGWLNETFHDGEVETEDVFHYQINVVWRSAVVYSDNLVLDKTGYVIGPTEVYNVRFMFTLCNSTSTADAVRNLNLWIYYPNVTEWHDQLMWHTVPPEPQDYEACEDSVFPCEKRVTLISSADADGVVSFDLIPGPRFMNTTWKYVFSANHSAITWLDDLVHTKLVLNNETFGDNGLRLAGRLSIDVPIMLAAAKEVTFAVLTWRDEAGRLVPYPITGYTVKYMIRNLDAGIVAAQGSGVTDAEGKVVVPSGTTPTTAFWVGMTIRYRVEPPAYTSDYADAFWKKWLEGKEVELVDKKGEYVAPAVPPKMTHAYFPDESPSAYALTEIDTVLVPREDGKYDCIGLCVFNARSKPFLVRVDYTAVTVQVTDFNGRPIEGAFVLLVDKATGKIAAWHYTAGKPWTAKPVNDVYLKKYHVVRLVDEDRSFGGAGVTGVMNVSIGPVKYDVDNDDKIDIDLSDRGYIGGRLITYIIRTFYLPAQPAANVEAMRPVWPYLPNKAQEVYNSERDGIEWKVMLPRALPEGTLYIPSDIAPTGSLVKEHADVRAAIFDAKMRFGYEGKTLTADVARDLKITVEAKEIGFKAEFSGKDTVSLLMLPRGTYTVEAVWKGETVARKTFDLSNVNVGTVTMDVDLSLTDAIFEVKDLQGRPVVVAAEKVTIEEGPFGKMSVKDNKVNIVAMVKHLTYTVSVGYAGYGKETAATYVGVPEGLKALTLPVGDVVITVVDLDGRPVGGATVKLATAEAKTDSQGRVVFQMVPLEDAAGRSLTYDVTVTREVTVPASITTSRSTTSFTILYGLGEIDVVVKGSAGQMLSGAAVELYREGVLYKTGVTDEKGAVVFRDLPAGTYRVKVAWKGYRDEKSVTLSDADIKARKPVVVEFSLPPFTEIAGIPLDFGTFVALIIGIILLVIVLAVIISEYVRWRGRRLGIYPPPPPKK